mgnify:CR=1 FL=1
MALLSIQRGLLPHWKPKGRELAYTTRCIKAMGIVKDYQEENFGETDLDYSSPESVVNMLTYTLGEQWMMEEGDEFIQNYIN